MTILSNTKYDTQGNALIKNYCRPFFSTGNDVAGSFRWVNGTYGDWWTPETTEEYDKRAACFRDYYSTLKAGPYLIDGIKHTVGIGERRTSSLGPTYILTVLRFIDAGSSGVSAPEILVGGRHMVVFPNLAWPTLARLRYFAREDSRFLNSLGYPGSVRWQHF